MLSEIFGYGCQFDELEVRILFQKIEERFKEPSPEPSVLSGMAEPSVFTVRSYGQQELSVVVCFDSSLNFMFEPNGIVAALLAILIILSLGITIMRCPS